MNSTTITFRPAYGQAADRHRADFDPENARPRGIGQSLLEWLGRVGERSGMARRAEDFARLNALGDDELAARGLHREELLVRCFGGRVLL